MLSGSIVDGVSGQGSVDGGGDAHLRRKLTGKCHDCELDTEGTHCPEHQRAANERQRTYAAAKRADHRKRGLCAECPTPSKKHYRCLACRKAHQAWKRERADARGALRRVARRVDALAPVRIDDATRVDADGRTRYHGKGQRGRQPTSVLDEADVRLMQQTLARAVERIRAWHELPAAMDRAFRRRALLLALDDFALLERLIGEEFLERHRYGQQADHAQDRRLGGK